MRNYFKYIHFAPVKSAIFYTLRDNPL